MARKSQQQRKPRNQKKNAKFANCPNSPTRAKKATRRGGRRSKFTASGSYEGFGLKGQFAYSKQNAPAAIGLSGTVRAPVTRSTSGGEVTCGSSLMFMAPTEDCSMSFDIQPGLSNIFPQLAPKARLFSKYRFKKLQFRWITRCGTGTPGQVTLAFNPDVQMAPPINFTEATSYEGTAFGAVWTNTVVLHARPGPPLFIRTGPVPAEGDPKTFDMGKLTVLLDDLPTTLPPTGFIQCDYEVEFTDRVLIPPSGCEFIPTFTSTDGNANDFWTTHLSDSTLPVVNPMVEFVSIPDDGLYMGLPAGYWLVVANYSAATVPGSIADFYPLVFTASDEGEVYQVPGTQWTLSGTLLVAGSGGVCSSATVIYNPTSAVGTPELAPAGWFQISVTGDGAASIARSAAMMLCFFPTEQHLTESLPGYNPKPQSRPRNFTHRITHRRNKLLAATSDPNRLTAYKLLDHTPVPTQMTDRIWKLYFEFGELTAKHSNICAIAGYPSIEDWLEMRSAMEVVHMQLKDIRQTCLRIDPAASVPPLPALLTRVQERQAYRFFEDDLPTIEDECDKNKTGNTCK